MSAEFTGNLLIGIPDTIIILHRVKTEAPLSHTACVPRFRDTGDLIQETVSHSQVKRKSWNGVKGVSEEAIQM